MQDSATGRSERWRRFGILDFLLLFPAFSIGLTLMRAIRADAQDSLRDAAPSLLTRGTFEIVLGGLVLARIIQEFGNLWGSWGI